MILREWVISSFSDEHFTITPQYISISQLLHNSNDFLLWPYRIQHVSIEKPQDGLGVGIKEVRLMNVLCVCVVCVCMFIWIPKLARTFVSLVLFRSPQIPLMSCVTCVILDAINVLTRNKANSICTFIFSFSYLFPAFFFLFLVFSLSLLVFFLFLVVEDDCGNARSCRRLDVVYNGRAWGRALQSNAHGSHPPSGWAYREFTLSEILKWAWRRQSK